MENILFLLLTLLILASFWLWRTTTSKDEPSAKPEDKPIKKEDDVLNKDLLNPTGGGDAAGGEIYGGVPEPGQEFRFTVVAGHPASDGTHLPYELKPINSESRKIFLNVSLNDGADLGNHVFSLQDLVNSIQFFPSFIITPAAVRFFIAIRDSTAVMHNERSFPLTVEIRKRVNGRTEVLWAWTLTTDFRLDTSGDVGMWQWRQVPTTLSRFVAFCDESVAVSGGPHGDGTYDYEISMKLMAK